MAPSKRQQTSDAGFTMVELLIVMVVMAIVLAIAGTALISLTTSTNQGSSMVSEEQLASTAMAQIGHDIRSAHTLIMPSSATPGSQLELEVNTSSGPCVSDANPSYPPVDYQLVEWVYSSTTSTLKRETLDCSTGAVTGTSWTLTNVVNGASTPVFKYYNQYGSDISSTLNGAIANCTTQVAVDLQVGSSTTGVKSVEETQSIAMTDQIAILSQPGNGQC